MIKLEPGERVRTLGLYQPYAALMGHGKIETRWIRKGKKAPFPKGWYLLYSCKRQYTPQAVAGISGIEGRARINETLKDDSTKELLGAALFLAYLDKKIYIVPGMEDVTFVRYQSPMVNKVMVGLIFRNVRAIEPFEFKGKQGVGFLSADDLRKCRPMGSPGMAAFPGDQGAMMGTAY